MNGYKGRYPDLGQKVRVYRNLNRGGYSVADNKTGLVLGHAEFVVLTNARYVVRPSGQERAKRERRKNVHAWVEGEYGGIHFGNFQFTPKGKGKYNPFSDHKGFFDEDTQEPLTGPYKVVVAVGRTTVYSKE